MGYDKQVFFPQFYCWGLLTPVNRTVFMTIPKMPTVRWTPSWGKPPQIRLILSFHRPHLQCHWRIIFSSCNGWDSWYLMNGYYCCPYCTGPPWCFAFISAMHPNSKAMSLGDQQKISLVNTRTDNGEREGQLGPGEQQLHPSQKKQISM